MTPADLQRIRSSPVWRTHRIEVLHDTSVGSVIVKGQRAPRPAWRHQLLNGFARVAGRRCCAPCRRMAGRARSRSKCAGCASWPPPACRCRRCCMWTTTSSCMRCLGDAAARRAAAQGAGRLLWWQRGLRALVELHARDQYLSQAFARNFIACGDHLAMIDFEDDPLEVMTLEQAQARDWLAYLHASALAFTKRMPAPHAECVALLRAELARERAPVRQLVADTARRLRWMQRLPAGDGRGWRRHLAIFHAAVGLMLAADLPDDNLAKDPKVIHARHH